MAGEDDRTIVENGKNEAAEKQAPPKKKGGLMLFAGIGVGAIAIGIALALFVIKPMMSDSGGDAGNDKTEQVKSGQGEKESHGGGASEGLIHEISNIVVNPAGTGGSRFLSASFCFELESAQLKGAFEQREPLIRDALITILSAKTVSQLTDPKQKEIVRYQIKKRVSQLMHTEQLAAVYYTDFVLQ